MASFSIGCSSPFSGDRGDGSGPTGDVLESSASGSDFLLPDCDRGVGCSLSSEEH